MGSTLHSAEISGVTITDDAAPSAQDAPMTERGTLLAGRYLVDALLGTGGMGAVYRARDTELDELVALKMLTRRFGSGSSAIDAFRREVKLARRVTHRNVARTFDIGEHHGERFLTMELVDGPSLTSLVREGPLPLGRAKEIAVQLCAGLAAAHAAGVIHRDLKPENVLLAKDGRVVITDFGIARAIAVDAAGTQGGVAGTPAYMAPEQVEDLPDIDARADIYALGAILFELYTGERAWRASSIYKLAADKLTHPPPDPRAKRPDLPGPLADVVLRCMARDRNARHGTVDEIAQMLSAATPATDEAPLSRAEPTPETERVALPTPRGKSVAVLPLRNGGAPEDAYLADGITEDLVDMLSMTSELRVRARGAVARFAGSERDATEIGRELGVEVVAEGSVRRVGERVRVVVRLVSTADGFQLWARRFEVGLADALAVGDEAASAVCEALTLPWSAPMRVETRDPRAIDLYLKGRHAYKHTSEEATVQSIADLAEADRLAPNDPNILSALMMARTRLLFFREDPDEAEHLLALGRRILALAPHRIGTRIAIANIELAMGDVVDAARELETAHRLKRDDPDVLEITGHVLTEVDRIDESRACLEQALRIDPSRIAIAYELGHVMLLCGEIDEAIERLGPMPRDEIAGIFWFRRWRIVMWTRNVHDARELLPHAKAAKTTFRDAAVLVLELVAGLIDEKPVLADLAQRANVYRAQRRRSLMLQLTAETNAYVGHEDALLDSLEACADSAAIDIAWLRRCPLFAPYRQHPRFVAVDQRIADRAESVSKELSRRLV